MRKKGSKLLFLLILIIILGVGIRLFLFNSQIGLAHPSTAKQFEYLIISKEELGKIGMNKVGSKPGYKSSDYQIVGLNQLGAKGWVLMAVVPEKNKKDKNKSKIYFYLMREKGK